MIRRTLTARGGALQSVLRVVLGVCVGAGVLAYLLNSAAGTPSPAAPSSAQQALLDAARDRPGDPDLGRLFGELNARHFRGELPQAKVLWDPALDGLDEGEYRLNGMTDGRLILIKAAFRHAEDDVRRTLCHEMVHVSLMAEGRKSTAHDAPFQGELRRIFDEGCFPALWATPEEKTALGEWIDAQRKRLDAARATADEELVAIKSEEARVERLFTGLNERILRANAAGAGWPSRDETAAAEQQRAALSERIAAHNAAVAAIDVDVATLNESVERYNLMMAYPDGLAEDRAKGLIR